jgi:sarcosine oxidase
LRDRERVTRIRAVDGAYEVETDETRYEAGSVVLTTDAWTNDLLGSFERHIPLQVTKEQVTYFESPDPGAFAPDRFPVWIWMDDPSFYGFPVYGEAGPKVAQDCGGQQTTADTRTFEPDPAIQERVRTFLASNLPGVLGPQLLTKTCLYTITPDRDFVIDRLPDAPGVAVGLGAAHGFKYASVIGRVLIELVLDGSTPSAGELDAFRIDRPVLLATDPTFSPLV